MNKKYKNLFRDMGIFALGVLGSKFVLFFLVPIYTHVLSDSEYGIADLVFTIGELMLPLVSLAIFNGLLRYGLIKEKKKDALLCVGIVFVIGSLFVILLTPFFDRYNVISEWKWYLCANVIASFARANTFVYLKVQNKNQAYSAVSIIQAILLVFCNIITLVLFRLGVHGYLLSTVFSTSIVAILAFKLSGMWADIKQATYDSGLMKEIVFFSIPFVFNDISWWIIHSFNKVMIEWLIGSAMLGIYAAASKIPALINAVASIFSQAWVLAAVREYETTNDISFYSTVFRYFNVLIFGFAIIIIAVIKPFMHIYVGRAFIQSWHYVPLLLVSAVFMAMSVFAGNMFSALKQSRVIMTSAIFAGIINVAINYFFIPTIGVYGAVIGTVCAYFSIAMLRLFELKKSLNIDLHIKRLLLLIVLLLTQATLVGFDFHVFIISAITLITYLFIVNKDILPILKMIKAKFC
jgi:Membrane protein involved in the export of O-antigen and teichoic acid